MTAALATALRAHAAGLPAEEAGTGLLISHGSIVHRHDFTPFVHTGTSISDPATLLAWIDWDTVLHALHTGQIPVSGGERHVLQLAASLAAGTHVSLRDTIPGLDNRNLKLLLTAIQHAAGHHPGHL